MALLITALPLAFRNGWAMTLLYDNDPKLILQ